MVLIKKVKEVLKKKNSVSDKESFMKKTEYYARLQKAGIIKKEEYRVAPLDTIGKTYEL